MYFLAILMQMKKYVFNLQDMFAQMEIHVKVRFENPFTRMISTQNSSKNPKTPKLSSMADDAITLGYRESSISPLYLCTKEM